MKKLVLGLLGIIAMGLSAQTASAWVDPGHLVYQSPHNYRCDPGPSYCSQSQDPNDPSENVGDHVLINYPNGRGVEKATIVAITPANDPAEGNGSPALQVRNEVTGETDIIITDLK